MAALPYKYHRAAYEPSNLFALAALPDGSGVGLDEGTEYSIQNLSDLYMVWYEEREDGGTPGRGQYITPGRRIIYDANADSPMFVWTDNPRVEVDLAISELR